MSSNASGGVVALSRHPSPPLGVLALAHTSLFLAGLYFVITFSGGPHFPGPWELNLVFPRVLYLIPLTRFPGFVWLIAAGFALPTTLPEHREAKFIGSEARG
jgi:hypothetical protein